MKPENTRIIIIDDHPLLVQVYRYALEEIEKENREWKFEIDEANDSETAFRMLNKIEITSQSIDLVFLDLKISVAENDRLMIGEDIGLDIRLRFPSAKIIVNTSSSNNYWTYNILKSLKPEGFLINADVHFEILKPAILTVLEGDTYYSPSVLKTIVKNISHDISLDKWDRRLLYELSQGVKMKELPLVLPYSLGAIEKRKRLIKRQFNLEDCNDRQLLDIARKYGFI